MTDRTAPERRGLLRALGLAALAAPAVAGAAGTAHRADVVPSGTARKETRDERTKARYQADSPHVKAFYATNRY